MGLDKTAFVLHLLLFIMAAPCTSNPTLLVLLPLQGGHFPDDTHQPPHG